MNETRQLNAKYRPIRNRRNDTNLDVLKPFVKFGFGALKAIAKTLIAIVRSIPKPHQEDQNRQDKIVVKR